ncbi:MAG: hypothetical protein WCP45_05850 [Verrucomicrobiota bacterium]
MRFLALCLLFLCPVMGHAQDSRKVSCRFVCFEDTPPPPPLLNVIDKGVEVTCTILPDTFSPEVVCTAKSNVIGFISSVDRKPAATAAIPPGVNRVILIFFPPGKEPNALSWRVYVIDDSPKNFPDGGALVVNFHTQDLRIIIGEHKIQLKPGKCHGFAKPEQRDAFNMAETVVEFQQKETWLGGSETLLRYIPGMRYLIFAHFDPVAERPRVTTYQDFSHPAAPPPKSK